MDGRKLWRQIETRSILVCVPNYVDLEVGKHKKPARRARGDPEIIALIEETKSAGASLVDRVTSHCSI